MNLRTDQKTLTYFPIMILIAVFILPAFSSFASNTIEVPNELSQFQIKNKLNPAASDEVFPYNVKTTEAILSQSMNGSGNFTAYCSSQFTIYVNYSEKLNIKNATIFYRTESNSTYLNVSMSNTTGINSSFYVTNTTMNLSIYRKTENISYYAIGYNVSSNETFYNNTAGSDWNITVLDDVNPAVVSGTGLLTAGTGDYFEIYVNFTDNINTSNARIFFKEETGSNYYQMDMMPFDSQLPGVESFVINILNLSEISGICTINCTTPIFYYVLGYDDANNTGNFTNFGIDWKITLIDNDDPEKVGGSGDFDITTGEPFIIYANFTDNIAISHAEFYYKRKGSEEPFKTIDMNETIGLDGNFFVTDIKLGIDTSKDNTAILYYAVAYDESGNSKTYTKPNYWWKVNILDNDPPMLHSASQNVTIGTGDPFNIYANFSDNIDLDFIRFYYKNEAWNHWEFNEFTSIDTDSDKIWEYFISSINLDVDIDTTSDDSDYYYYIKVFDNGLPKANKYNYSYGISGFKISVVDDDPPVLAKPVSEQGSKNMRATTGEKFTIYANFTDNIEVDYAILYLRKESSGNGWQTIINMTESETKPGRFSITSIDLNINTTTDETNYEYYIECFDTTGNYYAFDLSGEPFTIDVIDNDDPISIAGDDVSIEAGTLVHLNGNGSFDNIGIVSYEWSFIYDRLEKIFDVDKTSFKFETVGYYKIILTVKDAANNIGTDELWVNVSEKNYPPEIKSFFPEEGKKVYVFQDINIWVKFNEDMDIDRNNVGFFFVNDSDGNPIDGKFDWFVDKVSDIYQLTFTPNGSLEYDEKYTVTITRNVNEKHSSGLLLKAGNTWSFSTFSKDSDNDGLLDDWEVNNFGNINQVGPTDDPDNDGFTNQQEHDAETDPNNKKSHPPVDEPPVEENLNMFLIAIVVIFIILILIILIVGIMAWKKKKVEDEEAQKPKPIEHEILFEDGGPGLPGPVGGEYEGGVKDEGEVDGEVLESATGATGEETAMQPPTTEGDIDNVMLEPELTSPDGPGIQATEDLPDAESGPEGEPWKEPKDGQGPTNPDELNDLEKIDSEQPPADLEEPDLGLNDLEKGEPESEDGEKA
jgi:hypothetical protein